MNTKLDQMHKLIPTEIKMIFEDAPKDYIDWALIMYLFINSKCKNNNSIIFEEKNIITVGKISKWFGFSSMNILQKLNRMKLWVSVETVYGYHKPFYTCCITEIGIDMILKTMNMLTSKKL